MRIDLPLASSTWGTEEVNSSYELLKSGRLTMGAEVSSFEEEFAGYIGSKFAVMFNSGSSANLALFYGLRYMKDSCLKEGDEVIVPAVSWSTTFYPINQSGLILKFVDIDSDTLNISIEKIEEAIGPKTRAIFAVNLLGNPADLIELRIIASRFNLILLEDNCESLGASINNQRTGSLGFAGTHSFFFSHHICTMEGGMVTTNSIELAEALKSIRAHGWLRGLPTNNTVHPLSLDPWVDSFRFALPGFNLRPIELSGLIGRIQLKKFPRFLEAREANAIKFQEMFGDSPYFSIQLINGKSSWFGFSLVLKGYLEGKRKDIIPRLTQSGVETRPIVAGNFVRNPVVKHLKYEVHGKLESADYIHDNGFFVGNHHFDIQDKVEKLYYLFADIVKQK